MPSAPIEDEKRVNDIAFELLRKSIYDGLVFAFIGSGCSKKIGYPLWPELITGLEREVKIVQPDRELNYNAHTDDTKDPLWYAEILKNYIPHSYDAFIFQTFKPREDGNNTTPFHQTLLKIPFRHYLTSNYDTSLEFTASRIAMAIMSCSHHEKEKLIRFFNEMHEPATRAIRYILHLHGIYDKPDSIILTEQDYLRLYMEDSLVCKILWSIIASFRICFIGFKLADLDVLSVFRKAHWDCGRGQHRHYAIMEAEDNLEARRRKRQYLRDKYGVDPIFFSKASPDDYSEQEAIVQKLAEISDQDSAAKMAARLREAGDANAGV